MQVCKKDVGCPGLIQTLKNVLAKRRDAREQIQVRLQIEMRDGLSFIDEIVEVSGEVGAEIAVLRNNTRIEINQIEAITSLA